jgi:G:T/U-mismatch repair DNA glycosylase
MLAATRLFVLPSTSPANAAVPLAERLRWFRELHDWLAAAKETGPPAPP